MHVLDDFSKSLDHFEYVYYIPEESFLPYIFFKLKPKNEIHFNNLKEHLYEQYNYYVYVHENCKIIQTFFSTKKPYCDFLSNIIKKEKQCVLTLTNDSAGYRMDSEYTIMKTILTDEFLF